MSSISGESAQSAGPNNALTHEKSVDSHGPPSVGKPRKFAHGFWDKELAPLRAVVFKIVIGTTALIILVCWICLPLYWGSLWKSNRYTDKLAIRVINYDGGSIGEAVVNAALENRNAPTHAKLGYFVTDPSEFPNVASIEHDVVNEGSWGAMVIREGATAALATARQLGDASYNPADAIQFYYSQARNEQAFGSYIVPMVQQLLTATTVQYSAQSAAEYLTANAGNATALSLLSAAPRTVSGAVSFTFVNLRPYDQPVAAAITLVGLIYMLIFAFIVTMSFAAAREVIAPYMRTSSYIMLRLAVPILCYAVISFFYAMINLPFKVHFGARYTHAGGFFLWWVTLWLGMGSVGLATEFFVTVLTPRFAAFSLFLLIISNVSVAVLPHELQPWIYRYGVAMPFYNAGRVVRTIIFDTRDQIGQNIGILIAWCVVSCITIPLVTWLYRRNAVNAHMKETGQNQKDQVNGVDLPERTANINESV